MFPLLSQLVSRRTADVWLPTALPSLALWLQASPTTCFTDDPPTVPCVDTNPIRVWTGLGSTPNVTQATSGNRPTFRAVAGKYYSNPDGVDDLLSGAVAAILPPCTVYLIVKIIATTNVVISHDAGGNNGWRIDFNSRGINLTYGGVAGYAIAPSATLNLDTWYRVAFRISATQVRCRYETTNLTAVPVGTASGTPTQVSLHGLTWNASFYSGYSVTAALAYRAEHTDGEVDTVMSYLAGLKP